MLLYWDREAVTIVAFHVVVNIILTETNVYYLKIFRGRENFSLSTSLKFNFVKRSDYCNADCSCCNT
jgi:hypothetical protein